MNHRILFLLTLTLTFCLTSGAFAQGEASVPNPQDGGSGIFVDQVLSWTPGRFVSAYAAGQAGNGHHVFIHTNESYVTGGNLLYPLGVAVGHYRADGDSWTSTDALPFGPGTPLTTETTYYWKVIEVNDTNPLSPWVGEVWSFSTIGPEASNPDPANNDIGVALDVTLTWTAGTQVGSLPSGGHDIYFGTSETDVTNGSGGVYAGRSDDAEYTPGTLNLETTYYWRVDEVNDTSGTVTGAVWSFITAGYTASDPSPADDSLVGELYNSTVDVTLLWKAGVYTADTLGHDVYLGTNFDEVNDLNSVDPDPNNVYQDRQTNLSYQLTDLPLDVTYY